MDLTTTDTEGGPGEENVLSAHRANSGFLLSAVHLLPIELSDLINAPLCVYKAQPIATTH